MTLNDIMIMVMVIIIIVVIILLRTSSLHLIADPHQIEKTVCIAGPSTCRERPAAEVDHLVHHKEEPSPMLIMLHHRHHHSDNPYDTLPLTTSPAALPTDLYISIPAKDSARLTSK